MTVQVLQGSKQEIAEQVAAISGEVREAIVFIEEPSDAVPASVEEFFAEMEPYMVHVGNADDSREALYTRMEGE
jgi:hypothetical protein